MASATVRPVNRENSSALIHEYASATRSMALLRVASKSNNNSKVDNRHTISINKTQDQQNCQNNLSCNKQINLALPFGHASFHKFHFKIQILKG